jgi:hypothetical protein
MYIYTKEHGRKEKHGRWLEEDMRRGRSIYALGQRPVGWPLSR